MKRSVMTLAVLTLGGGLALSATARATVPEQHTPVPFAWSGSNFFVPAQIEPAQEPAQEPAPLLDPDLLNVDRDA